MSQPAKPSPRTTKRSARRQQAIERKQRERRQRIIVGGIVAAIAVAAVLVFANLPEESNAPEIDYAAIPSNGTVLGQDSATVQIVEYADYQCPFCADFALEVVPQLIEDFVETGQATFEFRAFPFLGGDDLTSPDNESVQAAEAAICALDQGKFWDYNHHLFVEHDGENQGAYSNDNLKRFAEELELDTEAFNTCLDSGTHEQHVLDQYAAYQAEGIDSTPTIFINGQSIPYTTQGYDLLKRQIEAAIAGERIPLS